MSGERQQQCLSFLCMHLFIIIIVFFIFTPISLSVFAKPGPVLLQSSDAELHCDITGDPKTEVQWMRPNGEKYNKNNQVIHLKTVTSEESGQWTCQVKDDLKLSVKLIVVGGCPLVVVIQNECFFITVILYISCCQWRLSGSPTGLQTTAVNVSKGDDIELPCSLPQSVSQRVVGGKWTADHLNGVSFPTLTNTEDKGLHWNGEDLSKVNFTTGQLSTNFHVTLNNVNTLHCF